MLTSLARARAATIRLNLLGAARALLESSAPPAEQPGELEVRRVATTSGALRLEAVPPPLRIDGATLEQPVGVYAASSLVWRDELS